MTRFDEFHTWTDVATIYRFNNRFRYDGDYGVRGLLTDDNWTLVYARPSVRYRNRTWISYHGGVALFYNYFNDTGDLPELRPWIGIRLVGPRPNGWVFGNYFRTELRAYYIADTGQWDEQLRVRWQLQATTPRFSIGNAENLYALASVEVFADIGDVASETFGDRFRTNIGLGKNVTDHLRIDLNYLFHQIRIEDEGGRLDADDHVVRMRFFYTINPL